jgi:pyroglutamyl-peptidase
MRLIRNTIVVGIFLLIAVSSSAYGVFFTNVQIGENNIFDPIIPIVLVTGFEPFDIYEINLSQLIAETLDGQHIEGAEIVSIILPVDFDESVEVVTQAIETYDPVIVISVGLSPRTRSIDVEKCGLNLKRLMRNESLWFIPRKLDPSGPSIRLSNLYTREIVVEIRKVDIPVRQSVFAGMYVCNAVLYGVLGYIDEHEIPTRAGFIHVPLLTSQDPDGMDLETMVEAVKLAIKTSLK